MGRPDRQRSIHWYAGSAVAGGGLLLLLGGAVVFLRLLRETADGLPRAPLWAFLGLLLLTGLFVLFTFLRARRRLSAELGGLVLRVEQAGRREAAGLDPAHPSTPLRIAEFERLRLALERLIDRLRDGGVRRSESEKTLGYALEHAADAVLVLDGARRILAWNRACEETFGFAPGEINGLSYADLVPGGEEEAELRAPLDPGRKIKDFRTRRRRHDGSLIDVSLTRSRFPSAPPGDERFLEILRDITATRRLEEDLLRSEKMAAVGKISSKVVHEIRNPLASINLNVDLLLESWPEAGLRDPEALENLQVIKREVRRLSQITEEYLQFSRLPRAAFRRERVNDILVELSDFVRPLIGRKGVRLTLILDDSDPEAICDATLLRQALLNLLRNAVDATVEGEGVIQMTTRAHAAEPEARERSSAPPPEAGMMPPAGTATREAPDHAGSFETPLSPFDQVEISVADNGCGIAAELLDRIYEPFFTTKRDGTGLGLALVQRAVEEHSGSIRCESLPGKGTTFRLVIPCAPPATAARAGSTG